MRESSQLTPFTVARLAMGDKDVGIGDFFGAVKAFGRDADDGVGLLVEANGFSDDVGVGGKIIFPGRPR